MLCHKQWYGACWPKCFVHLCFFYFFTIPSFTALYTSSIHPILTTPIVQYESRWNFKYYTLGVNLILLFPSNGRCNLVLVPILLPTPIFRWRVDTQRKSILIQNYTHDTRRKWNFSLQPSISQQNTVFKLTLITVIQYSIQTYIHDTGLKCYSPLPTSANKAQYLNLHLWHSGPQCYSSLPPSENSIQTYTYVCIGSLW